MDPAELVVVERAPEGVVEGGDVEALAERAVDRGRAQLLGQVAGHRLRDWQQLVVKPERGTFAQDPWLAYATRNSRPARASEIPATTKRHQAVVELAARFGFRSVVVVPAPSGGMLTRIGVLCLGSKQEGFFDDDESYAVLKFASRSLAMELHEWWVAQVKRELLFNARISSDDLDLLRLERLGRSTKQIAAELNMSAGSVNSRFQRVNEKLGVPSRRAAAILAGEYGLI